jgi:glycosyltransferase involved in cell wall biosynthesis
MGNSVRRLIKSLLNQTYKNIEIILVDDGSTDNSLEICRKLNKEDPRIKVVHEKNSGSGTARNFGIENASGYYAYFPDADDEVKDEKAIEKLVAKMESTESDLIVFGFEKSINNRIDFRKQYENVVFDGDYVRNNYEIFINMYNQYGIQGAPWNKFFRMDIIKNNRVQYPTLRRHQDEVFISRYMSHAAIVCFIDEIYYTYYANDLKKEWDKYPKDYLCIIEELYNYRKIIMEWNPENIKVKKYIEDEYICNVIKALELSFSKKQNLNYKTRKEWISNAIDQSNITENELSNLSLKYQNRILQIIKDRNYNKLYFMLQAKVFVEKNYYFLFNKFKEMIRN